MTINLLADFSCDNAVAVVTGGTGVLCSAMARALLAAGAKVALLGRTQSKLDDLTAALKKEGYEDVLPVNADVCDREALVQAKAKINERFGKVTHLINGAGGNRPGATAPLEELTESADTSQGFLGMDIDDLKGVMDLNFVGTVLPSQIFSEDMIGNGCIINVSSMSAQLPLTKVAGYSAAKAAVDNHTRWLSVHFAKVGIRVNAIAPGFFVTNQNRFLLFEEDAKTPTARGGKIINNTPMGRFGDPEDLQSATVFLASPGARFITGIVLPVDGGFSAYSGV